MAMDILSLLKGVDRAGSVDKLAETLNLDGDRAQHLVAALSPALSRGLQKQKEQPGGFQSLTQALSTGRHERYVDHPELLQDESTRADGNKILGHLFGSKDVSRNVATKVASDTGISADLVKKALPLVAGLAMGALSKQTSAKGQSPQPDVLDGLLGGLIGGSSDDGVGIDDILGLARKFF